VAPSPYAAIDSWVVPLAAVEATLAGVVFGGRRGVESGTFWLGTRASTSTVEAVVMLRGRGVVEEAGLWEISPETYGQVSRWARARRLVLLATAHTHGYGVPARLSGLDRRHLVRAPDLLALVLGEAGEECDPARWSWNVCVNGSFRALEGREFSERVTFTAAAPVALACADVDGVDPWDGDVA
jgi:hypothetical protein